MLERQIVIPATPEHLWHALTEPESLSAWFGAQVEWDLRPGGRARFVEDDGTVRRGVIDAVRPGRHLRFRWWPETPEGEQGDRDASQVSYDLEPEEDGTRLTVTERRVPATVAPARTGDHDGCATACLSSGETAADRGVTIAGGEGVWSEWDTRMFRCWARSASLSWAGGALR